MKDEVKIDRAHRLPWLILCVVRLGDGQRQVGPAMSELILTSSCR